MEIDEKRRHKRLTVKLDLSCCETTGAAGRIHRGYTVNVSPGGLYFETSDDVFEPAALLKVELSIPPTTGLLESGGRISGLAKVLRTCDTAAVRQDGRYGVALEFCQPLKLRT